MILFSRVLRVLRRPRQVSVAALVVAALVAGVLAAVHVTAGRGAPAARAGTAVPVQVVRGHRVRVRAMPA
jgi:hypothetical protein